MLALHPPPQAIVAAHGAAAAGGPRLGRCDGRMPAAELPAHLLSALAATAARTAAHLGAAPPLAASAVEHALLYNGAEASDAVRAATASYTAASLSADPEQIEEAVGAALQSPCRSRQPRLPPELTGEEPCAARSWRRPCLRSNSPFPVLLALEQPVLLQCRGCRPKPTAEGHQPRPSAERVPGKSMGERTAQEDGARDSRTVRRKEHAGRQAQPGPTCAEFAVNQPVPATAASVPRLCATADSSAVGRPALGRPTSPCCAERRILCGRQGAAAAAVRPGTIGGSRPLTQRAAYEGDDGGTTGKHLQGGSFTRGTCRPYSSPLAAQPLADPTASAGCPSAQASQLRGRQKPTAGQQRPRYGSSSSTEVPTSSVTPTKERQYIPPGPHAHLIEARTTMQAEAQALDGEGRPPSAARAEITALEAKAEQTPRACVAVETRDQEEAGQADAQLVESIASWIEQSLTSADELSDRAVIWEACAAWRQAQRHSQAAALSAATLLLQCLRHWFLAGGDTDVVALVTQRTLIIIQQAAAPTPAQAACHGQKPPPNRKARK